MQLQRQAMRLWRRLSNPADTHTGTMTALSLLCIEAFLCAAIVKRVPYTEIDWSTYMQQVEGFQQGERDYSRLGGSTGPLVYPAGFLYIYTLLHWLSGGGRIVPAQWLFIFFYLITQAMVMSLYVRSKAVPPVVLVLLCLSKRLHSIFVLRMFNDGVAMMLAYAAISLLTLRRWRTSILAFSAAVSVKMNVLLMAPGVLIVLLKEARPRDIVEGTISGCLLQIGLAAPFLYHEPMAYVSRAFDFSRIFMHRWTVNLKFLPEEVFQAKSTAVSLLLLHLTLLIYFAQQKWCRSEGGVLQALRACWQRGHDPKKAKRQQGSMRAEAMLSIIFTSNFIGVACARSLHYQFYSWYFHTLPFLLWQVKMHSIVRCGMLLLVEIIWNIYPSTTASSACLTACHLAICIALQHQPMPSKRSISSPLRSRRVQS